MSLCMEAHSARVTPVAAAGHVVSLSRVSGEAAFHAVLPLCECQRAMGNPHGLTCEKEGWFVSGFENKGTWVS